MSELADEDVVVRGGIFSDPDDVLEAVEYNIEMGFGPVLSVFTGKRAEHASAIDAVKAACVDGAIPHGKVRHCFAKDLRDARFELVRDPSDGQGECHFHVLFPDPPTSVDADRFIGCFSEPVRNPAKESAQ